MTPYQVEWLEEAAGSRSRSGRWSSLVASIITAILVIALGVTVFGLVNADEPAVDPVQPAASEATGR
jgi:anti-sigma-K factor RskA